MSTRRLGLAALLVLAVLVPTLLARADGDDGAPPDPMVARKALLAAIDRGKTLWRGSWGEGTKACAECHTEGPNRMRAGRVRSYPKYDFGMGKVITLQQKLTQMIKEQSKGQPLPLGHEDLTAIEAYLNTIR